ncbi:hypothetical protein PoB_007720600 [Plakobranchus ocellatus]|uniref:Uncharacterized protein n=1 Tax=Plakobranchus ocellatus TaxID=259542 RepID=A0AAV4E4H6_9GAST|nr:hypothetical protein PoB_007720600 [Plakobranchus ocellatus]
MDRLANTYSKQIRDSVPKSDRERGRQTRVYSPQLGDIKLPGPPSGRAGVSVAGLEPALEGSQQISGWSSRKTLAHIHRSRGVGGTGDSESTLRSAGDPSVTSSSPATGALAWRRARKPEISF